MDACDVWLDILKLGASATHIQIHAECLSLAMVGHAMSLCRCTDYQGLGKRQAARVLARLIDPGAVHATEPS